MNFLSLTNRILKAFNEVQLDSTTFGSAYGFYAEAQDAINRAVFDIYTEEDVRWPFAYATTTFVTVIGQQPYTLNQNYVVYDWDSFYITKPQIQVTGFNKVSTTITVTTLNDHQMIVGDPARFFNIADNASSTYYNANATGGATTGWTIATVPSSTTFTFTVPASSPTPTVMPSSYVQPPYQAAKIELIDYNTYEQNGLADDINGITPQAVPSSYNTPAVAVRERDNSITLSPVPDRLYSITYGGYTFPTAMVNWNDTTNVPAAFEQVIVDKALEYAYMFRDNAEEAQIASDRYTKNVNKMRRLLIPQTEYMRFDGV